MRIFYTALYTVVFLFMYAVCWNGIVEGEYLRAIIVLLLLLVYWLCIWSNALTRRLWR